MSHFWTHPEILLLSTPSNHYWSTKEKDTVSDSSALDVPMLREVQLDELAEAARVVIINCLGVSKGLQNWAARNKAMKMEWWCDTITTKPLSSLLPFIQHTAVQDSFVKAPVWTSRKSSRARKDGKSNLSSRATQFKTFGIDLIKSHPDQCEQMVFVPLRAFPTSTVSEMARSWQVVCFIQKHPTDWACSLLTMVRNAI